MHILVTGGAGYIGSHTIIELLQAGHTVEVVDNLSNSNAEVMRRIEELSGKKVPLHVFDLKDKVKTRGIFKASVFDGVIHFAGLKAVGESTQKPLTYYRTNLDSTLTLLETMQEFNVKQLVFSSSATVYGSSTIPYNEFLSTGQGITNPYGQTKYIIEQILKDTAKADGTNCFTVLRYFNPIGAHASGRIGEDPSGVPNNLMPYITQVASGKRKRLSIFGNDYNTIDGTGVRDYIHVVDLAKGHLAALENSQQGWSAYNLGSGKGTSVLELIHAFEQATGIPIPYEFAPRRAGDLPEYYADASKALNELHWKTEKTIEEACADSWRWQSQNPNGYRETTQP
ncbi:MAG TPA: UDP-glucose 4-epimerase GalE [Candidatus Saccharimonadales bacterium]|nr:UDP-glucose 4-epimerase GalE [Candidatus Saccharimonadales bacterium]